ncbi:hypothetical protein L218DRAFT_193722 [Marasmius fiardii PR-910]|nr:hypothetical protein L218DRAFT_193722 [Marasmius fiardii PR-910]
MYHQRLEASACRNKPQPSPLIGTLVLCRQRMIYYFFLDFYLPTLSFLRSESIRHLFFFFRPWYPGGKGFLPKLYASRVRIPRVLASWPHSPNLIFFSFLSLLFTGTFRFSGSLFRFSIFFFSEMIIPFFVVIQNGS